MTPRYHPLWGPWWSFCSLDLMSVISSVNSFYLPSSDQLCVRESVGLCLGGREVQDKLRGLRSHLDMSQLCRAHCTAQFTTQQEPTVLSDHYFSQIKSSGRGGVQLTQCRIIWLPVKCQTINVKGMAMVEVCVQIFTLVTRGQFSPQIIISGRYWRYLQTWHLPPPHIIFSCNKSGFPAPGNRGGFVTTAHNYYHLDGQYPAINQYFSSAQHLSRLPWIENFIKNVNISNVYCKSSDGQDHPEKSI